MTVTQFNSLDEMEKVKAIGYHAEKLTSRKDESIYIEEKIEKRSGNSFLSPSHFSTKVELMSYL